MNSDNTKDISTSYNLSRRKVQEASTRDEDYPGYYSSGNNSETWIEEDIDYTDLVEEQEAEPKQTARSTK